MERAKDKEQEEPQAQQHRMSDMKPVTKEAYGGGMYGKDDDEKKPEKQLRPRASETQCADGPEEATVEPKHQPPPSTGDRDLDITGQSYIQ
ncbi:uncharacterized protein LOC120276465 [Dioscorea cayenensis subsp. rotundata]|uniref:Uncharacterized protein LOC120276465 n=1 Tax=Dioscorea cayennensis subsp. rotundata TaxID=55577 RepID=A0AB40CGN3_DIOCR|nr:uncharacterized protein LOC120276465 [Dioscorea cayenensis subsp. rotundata]